VADSHKRACKNEDFKSGKQFTVLNRFSKIKEVFTVKLKMIYHYFRPHQMPENVKIIFQKNFTPKQTEHKKRTFFIFLTKILNFFSTLNYIDYYLFFFSFFFFFKMNKSFRRTTNKNTTQVKLDHNPKKQITSTTTSHNKQAKQLDLCYHKTAAKDNKPIRLKSNKPKLAKTP